jgi:hypothetical protein
VTMPKRWPASQSGLGKNAAGDVADLEKEAKATGDSAAIADVNTVKQKLGNYTQFVSAKKMDNAKAMAKTVTDRFNKAVDSVPKTKDAAAKDTGKAAYSVKGALPAAHEMQGADATVTKARTIHTAMKNGKDPHQACKNAGVAERPTIIERTKGKHWVYEFRLSHGGTQYRLNAEARSADEGKNIEVESKYLGRGH